MRGSKSARVRGCRIFLKKYRRRPPGLARCSRDCSARPKAGVFFHLKFRSRGDAMTPTNTFLAVFLGSKNSPKWAAWNALSEADRRAKEQEGMAAWKAWVEKHQAAIVYMGGPLGKTKKVDSSGV